MGVLPSGVTESLFVGVGGGAWWADLRLGGPKGRHRNDFFHIIFIVHNQKSNGGPMVWMGLYMAPSPPPPIVMPLVLP